MHTMTHGTPLITASDLEDLVGLSVTIQGTAHNLSHINKGGEGFTAMLADMEGNLINIVMHVVCRIKSYLNVVNQILCVPGAGHETLDRV